MKALVSGLLLSVLGLIAVAAPAATASGNFAEELLSLQQEFDRASFGELGKGERKAAFAALVEHAADLSVRSPDRVEALAWNGIVLSAYAGEVSAISAMKYAKAARVALTEAEAMNPTALDGGIYASLGALYSKVPGGFVGFGDDQLATEYFAKALAVDSGNIDNNFFYAEFLLGQEQYTQALTVLQRALEAPASESRPLFDQGRRQAIRALIDSAEREIL
jgi:tetratricopeptide (TPR) repeat protein